MACSGLRWLFFFFARIFFSAGFGGLGQFLVGQNPKPNSARGAGGPGRRGGGIGAAGCHDPGGGASADRRRCAAPEAGLGLVIFFFFLGGGVDLGEWRGAFVVFLHLFREVYSVLVSRPVLQASCAEGFPVPWRAPLVFFSRAIASRHLGAGLLRASEESCFPEEAREKRLAEMPLGDRGCGAAGLGGWEVAGMALGGRNWSQWAACNWTLQQLRLFMAGVLSF